MTEPLPGFCTRCDHPDWQHGDRATGATCANSQYPNHCDCPGWGNPTPTKDTPA